MRITSKRSRYFFEKLLNDADKTVLFLKNTPLSNVKISEEERERLKKRIHIEIREKMIPQNFQRLQLQRAIFSKRMSIINGYNMLCQRIFDQEWNVVYGDFFREVSAKGLGFDEKTIKKSIFHTGFSLRVFIPSCVLTQYIPKYHDLNIWVRISKIYFGESDVKGCTKKLAQHMKYWDFLLDENPSNSMKWNVKNIGKHPQPFADFISLSEMVSKPPKILPRNNTEESFLSN